MDSYATGGGKVGKEHSTHLAEHFDQVRDVLLRCWLEAELPPIRRNRAAPNMAGWYFRVVHLSPAVAAIGALLARDVRHTVTELLFELREKIAKEYVPREVYQAELDETKRRLTQLEYSSKAR